MECKLVSCDAVQRIIDEVDLFYGVEFIDSQEGAYEVLDSINSDIARLRVLYDLHLYGGEDYLLAMQTLCIHRDNCLAAIKLGHWSCDDWSFDLDPDREKGVDDVTI